MNRFRLLIAALALGACVAQSPPRDPALSDLQQDATTPFAAGSLVIPMDTTYQDNGVLHAFGLLDALLRAGVPVNIAVASGKAAGGVDFTASGVDLQTGAAVTSYGYRGGPLVIDAADRSAALRVIRNWQLGLNAIAVHDMTAPFGAEVKRRLTAAPRLSVFQDGYEAIAFSYLNAAGIPDSVGQQWPASNLGSYQGYPDVATATAVKAGALLNADGTPAFCALSAMHYSPADDAVVAAVRTWLSNASTGALMECEAAHAFETSPSGFFLTTGGLVNDGNPPPNPGKLLVPDSAFAQFDGSFTATTGQVQSISLSPGSSFKGGGAALIQLSGAAAGTRMAYLTGHLDGALTKGKVSYLSGHQYSVALPISGNPQTNGARLFLDAMYQSPCTAAEGQPNPTLTSSVPAATNGSTITFTFSYTNPGPGPASSAVLTDVLPAGLTFASVSGGGTAAGQTVTWNLGNLAPGASGSVAVTANVTADGTYTNQATLSWLVSLTARSLASAPTSTLRRTAPPATTLGATPPALTNQTGASIGFTADVAGSTFKCSLDGGAFASCTSPFGASSLIDGAHTFKVFATDPIGNVESPGKSCSWAVDTKPPGTTITQQPSATTGSPTATFAFTSSKPASGAAFECKVDSGAFAACATPFTSGALADGPHSFSARAVDAAGNRDPSPPSASWTIDTRPPDTEITSGPPPLTSVKAATLKFTSSKAGSTFKCKLDAPAPATCTSPLTTAALGDGPHSFTVTATDALGNVDPAPPTLSWTVDTAPPSTSITGKPAALTRVNGGIVTFTASKPGSTFRCQLDQPGFSTCTSPFTLPPLAEGSHTFTVFAVDPAGNADPLPPSASWTLDTIAPRTAISSHPALLTNARTATFAFAADDPAATFSCKLDALAAAPCSSGASYSALGAGQHTFTVTGTDQAGNVEVQPPSFTWIIDLTPPATSIASGPKPLTNATSATLEFSSTKAGSTFACALDSGAAAPCSSAAVYAGLTAGPHVFKVVATDPAGNVDPVGASRSWTIDLTPPVTTLAGGPAALTNATSASFSIGASKPGATFQCGVDGGAWSACESTLSLSSLAAGQHSVSAQATDAAGNADPNPPSYAWVVDLTAPVTAIGKAPPALTNSGSASVEFTCSKINCTFTCALDGGAAAACTSPRALSGLLDGPHTLAILATDAAGNVQSAATSTGWTIDRAPPATTIKSGPPPMWSSPIAAFTLKSSKPGSTFLCSLDNRPAAACATPFSTFALADGPHTLTAAAADAAGNVDPAPPVWSWTVLTLAPHTSITSGPDKVTKATDASLSFTSTAPGAAFACSLDGAPLAACASPVSLAGLAAGSHVFAVVSVDLAGNADSSPPSWNWTIDTTGPRATITAGPAALTAATSATLAFEASKPGSSFTCQLDGAAAHACTSPAVFGNLAAGPHTFTVTAVDPAGNADAAPPSRSWTIELSAPHTRIVSGPPASTNQSSASIAFTADKAGASFRCQVDGQGFQACSSPLALAGLSDGHHFFEVLGTDALGNAELTPATLGWVVDTSSPHTLVLAGPPARSSDTACSFEFGSTKPAAGYQCALDGAATFTDCANPLALQGLPIGQHQLLVRAVDSAGNVDPSPAAWSWKVEAVSDSLALAGSGCSTAGGSPAVLCLLGALALARRRRARR